MIQPFVSSDFSTVDQFGGEIPDGGNAYGPGFCITWQRGPLGRGENRQPENGAFVETVISACKQRIEYYQQSKFANVYNAEAIYHLELALYALSARTTERENRGVEGTHSV